MQEGIQIFIKTDLIVNNIYHVSNKSYKIDEKMQLRYDDCTAISILIV